MSKQRQTKSFGLRSWKAEGDQGAFEAVFATLGVVDTQGDRIMPGAIGNQSVVISAYGHGSWRGELPVGKGRIFERGKDAVVEGQFFLDTTAGSETYKTVKNVGELQEWSFSLENVTEREATDDRRVRELLAIKTKEVSPVLRGAGIDTRLTAIKEQRMPGQQSKSFHDHASETLEAVKGLHDRAKKIRALREEKGKTSLSPQGAEQVRAIRDEMKAATVLLDDVLVDYNAEATELARSIMGRA